jgi:hypothetical protein
VPLPSQIPAAHPSGNAPAPQPSGSPSRGGTIRR